MKSSDKMPVMMYLTEVKSCSEYLIHLVDAVQVDGEDPKYVIDALEDEVEDLTRQIQSLRRAMIYNATEP